MKYAFTNLFSKKTKQVDLKSLVNFGTDLVLFCYGKVTYNYGNITIYLGIYTLCNPKKS